MPPTTSMVIVASAITIKMIGARLAKRRRKEILATVAERRRCSFDPGGWFGNPLLELETADRIAVSVLMLSTKHGRFTEYNAKLPLPGVPELELDPPGVVDRITNALTAVKRGTGDHDFDTALELYAEDRALALRMFRDTKTRRLALAYPKSRLSCRGRSVRLLQPVIASVEQVETGIDLLLELGRSDPYGLEVLDDLPEAEIRPAGDGLLEAQLPGPSPIRIGPLRRDRIVRTCARTAALGALPADAETLVTALGATLEQSDVELRIWWPSVETDVRRLTAAAELLRRLASGPALGVFR